MTGPERAFVDELMEILRLPAEPAPPAALSGAQRSFVERFVAILEATPVLPPTPAGPIDLSPEQRGFVAEFMKLAEAIQPERDPGEVFERVIIDDWENLMWRVQGAVAARFVALDDHAHRALRLLEDTPSLLRPLGLGRDEVTHSQLLGWALRLPGDLGDALRQRWLDHFGVTAPVRGWHVRNESTLGQGCRVDLEIDVPGRWLGFVEMKIDAGERGGQLPDYREHLDAACEARRVDGALVFLTVDGDASADDVDHEAMSLRDLLLMWLPLAQDRSPDASYLRSWLASIAQDVCRIAGRGPVERWNFSQRAAVLRLLEDLGAEDA